MMYNISHKLLILFWYFYLQTGKINLDKHTHMISYKNLVNGFTYEKKTNF